jgi:hypothetical protein
MVRMVERSFFTTAGELGLKNMVEVILAFSDILLEGPGIGIAIISDSSSCSIVGNLPY